MLERIGPYRILGELGRGGMGAVYRARRDDLERDFALKVILPEFAGDPEVLARFTREAQAAARLADVPGVAGVLDVGEHDGTPYLAMDYVDGGSLEELIDAGDLGPTDAVRLIEQAARAVQAAHDRGVLHRDLKPGNLLITAAGEVRVADFGLARRTTLDDASAKLTQTGLVLGTPAYMPPEQAQGAALDARADVYALGATLHEALLGEPPFPGETVLEVLGKLLREPVRGLRRRDPRISKDLETIVLKCLEKRPDDRYQDAGGLADDLARYLAGEPVIARPVGAARRAARVLYRRRRLIGLAALSAAALAAVPLAQSWKESGAAADTAKVRVATEARELADLANDISAAYFDLAGRGAKPLAVIEDAGFGAVADPHQVEAALAEIEALADELERAHPGVAVVQAWRGFARCLAGKTASGLPLIEEARARVPDDPFPAVFLARLQVSAFARTVSPPVSSFASGAVEEVRVTLPVDAQERLTASLQSFESTVASPVWTLLEHGAEYRDYVAAVAALAQEDYPAAAVRLQALQEHPQLGMEASFLRGTALFVAGDSAEASKAWRGPARRGWVVAALGLAVTGLKVAVERAAEGESPDAGIATAIRLLEGIRPSEDMETMVLGQLAQAWLVRAQYLRLWGGDAVAALARAEAVIGRAAEARGPGSVALVASGVALARAQLAADREDLEGMAEASRALALLDRLLEAPGTQHRDRLACRTNRAAAWLVLGQREEALGRSGAPHYGKALAECDQVCAAGVPPLAALHLRGVVRGRLALGAVKEGRDPRDLLDGMRADARVIHERRPDDARAWSLRGEAAALEARWWSSLGRDHREALRSAIAAFEQVLQSGGERQRTSMRLGDAWQSLGDQEARLGGEPEPAWRKAVAAYTRVAKTGFRQARVLRNRGLAWYSIGRRQAHRGAGGQAAFDAALADFDAAERLQPDSARTHAARAIALLGMGELQAAAGRDARDTWRRGLAAADRGLELDRSFAEDWQNRGALCIKLGGAEQARGNPHQALAEEALRSYDAAIALDPRHYYFRFMRGRVLLWLVRVDDAIGALETAQRLNPNAADVRQLLAQARAARDQMRGR